MKHNRIQAHGYKQKCPHCECTALGPECRLNGSFDYFSGEYINEFDWFDSCGGCLFHFGRLCTRYKQMFYNKENI